MHELAMRMHRVATGDEHTVYELPKLHSALCVSRHGRRQRPGRLSVRACGGAHVAELLRLGARKGGDARVRQQLAGHAVDGGRGHQEARRQLQVAIVLHHADEVRLRGVAQLSCCTAGADGTGKPGSMHNDLSCMSMGCLRVLHSVAQQRVPGWLQHKKKSSCW